MDYKLILWMIVGLALLVAVFFEPRHRVNRGTKLPHQAAVMLDARLTIELPKTVKRGGSHKALVSAKNTGIEVWGENVFLEFFQPGSLPVAVPFKVRSLPDWPDINGRVFRTKPPQFSELVPQNYEAEFVFCITIPESMKRGEYRFVMQLVQVVSEGSLSFDRFGEKVPVAFKVE